MNCPSCGKDSAPGTKFCENCGTPLLGEQTAQAIGQEYAPGPPPDQYQFPTYGPAYYEKQPGGQTTHIPDQTKNPGIAAILALFIPGAGHLYVGLIIQGIILLIFGIFILILGLVTIFGLVFKFLFWLWNIFDSYNKAKQYNDALQCTGRAPW